MGEYRQYEACKCPNKWGGVEPVASNWAEKIGIDLFRTHPVEMTDPGTVAFQVSQYFAKDEHLILGFRAVENRDRIILCGTISWL